MVETSPLLPISGADAWMDPKHAHSGTRQPSYIFSNYLKLALLSPCKSNGSSYQILLCRCSHCGNRHVLPCIINASQGQHVRELTLLAHFAWSTVWQKTCRDEMCERGQLLFSWSHGANKWVGQASNLPEQVYQ